MIAEGEKESEEQSDPPTLKLRRMRAESESGEQSRETERRARIQS